MKSLLFVAVMVFSTAVFAEQQVLLNRFDRTYNQMKDDVARDISYRVVYGHSEFPVAPKETARSFANEVKTTFRGNVRRTTEYYIKDVIKGVLSR